MADGTLTGSGDKLATDELATLNGADVSGQVPRLKTDRAKVGFGSDGDFRDVDSAHPLPATDAVAQGKLDVLHDDVGLAGDTPPALTANASGLIGWLRKIVDMLSPLATSAKQDTLKTSTDAITAKLTSDPSTAANQTSANTKLDTLHADNGGPGSSQPSLVNGGSGILGYLRNILDALRAALTVTVPAQQAWTRHPTADGTTFAATALRGMALRETSGTTSAVVKLLDGTTSGGTLLVPIALAPGESARDAFGPAGIAPGSGNVYVQVVSGAVEGAVFS